VVTGASLSSFSVGWFTKPKALHFAAMLSHSRSRRRLAGRLGAGLAIRLIAVDRKLPATPPTGFERFALE